MKVSSFCCWLIYVQSEDPESAQCSPEPCAHIGMRVVLLQQNTYQHKQDQTTSPFTHMRKTTPEGEGKDVRPSGLSIDHAAQDWFQVT